MFSRHIIGPRPAACAEGTRLLARLVENMNGETLPLAHLLINFQGHDVSPMLTSFAVGSGDARVAWLPTAVKLNRSQNGKVVIATAMLLRDGRQSHQHKVP